MSEPAEHVQDTTYVMHGVGNFGTLVSGIQPLSRRRCLGLAAFFLAIGLATVSTSVSAQSLFQASTTSEEEITGSISMLNDELLKLESSPGDVTEIRLKDLISIEQTRLASAPRLPTSVLLANGTKLVVAQASLAADDFRCTPVGQAPLTMPLEHVRAIRFRASSRKTDPTWLGLLDEEQREDRLVVRRDAETLDSIGGTIIAIDTKQVRFELGGNVIQASIEKLEGILFATSPTENVASGIRLIDWAGGNWVASAVGWSADASEFELDLELSQDTRIKRGIAIDRVQRIEFSSGRLNLAEAELAERDYEVGSMLKSWFQPIVNENDVVMHAPGEITFRVPDGYRDFACTVRRDGEVDEFVPLLIEVLLDGEIAWQQELGGRDPLGVELQLDKTRKLTLRASLPSNDEVDDRFDAAYGGKIRWTRGRIIQ